MKTIYKYPINFGKNVIEMRPNSHIRRFDIQDGLMYIWVEFEPAKERVERVFYVYGTGDSIEDYRFWCGTCFDDGYVWHLYEELL